MSESVKKDVQRLIQKSCATHYRNDQCLLETSENDCTCVYFTENNRRCSYFENSVLPGDKSLEFRYWAERGQEINNGTICNRCNELFEKRSNRQKYCDSCRSIIRNQQQRKYNREYRFKTREKENI